MQTMKRTMTAIAAGMLFGFGLVGNAAAQNFLDDMIYSVKCAGADDTEACKTKAKQDFDDYQKSKHQGSSVTVEADERNVASSDRCRTVSASGSVNVDTAYIRAVKTFHFMTQEELDIKTRSYRAIINPRFKHVRTPGLMYDLWGFIDIPGFKGSRPGAGLRLAKSEQGGTDMDVEYCLGGNNVNVSNKAFWTAADAAFRKLVQ